MSESSQPSLSPLKTGLYAEHRALGGNMIDFAGWCLPSHYRGVGAVKEHIHTRTSCGVFDVSHMGRICARGPRARDFLTYAMPSDVQALPEGQGRYSCLLSHKGGIVDDIFVYCLRGDHFLLCVNAASRVKVWQWLRDLAGDADGEASGLELEDVSERYVQLAVQGPRSLSVLKTMLGGGKNEGQRVESLPYAGIITVRFQGRSFYLARSGYTGEKGYELYIPTSAALGPRIWRALLQQQEVLAVGLSARNSLRLEAGFLLYGADMDEETMPAQVGLGWLVSSRHQNFVGSTELSHRSQQHSFLLGFLLIDKGVPRQGMEVLYQGKRIGTVTSGGYLPSLQRAGGYIFVDKNLDIKEEIVINIRGKHVAAEITPRPFYLSKARS